MSKITEKMLLDGFSGLTNGGDKISEINGQTIIWNYRYRHDEGCAVCDADRADLITLEYDRVGEIEIDEENRNHPSRTGITRLENELWGDEIYLESLGL